MAVEVIPLARMFSDVTTHQALYVGEEQWELSCLPGRQLTCDQAASALRVAEAAAALLVWMKPRAQELGLTERELLGCVAGECDWPRPPTPSTSPLKGRFGRRWSNSGGAA